MFVRLTFCKFLPEHIRQAKKIFSEDIIPGIRRQKNNLDAQLLEPTDKNGDFIMLFKWKTRADADAYELTKKLMQKFDGLFTKDPLVKGYHCEEVEAAIDHL